VSKRIKSIIAFKPATPLVQKNVPNNFSAFNLIKNGSIGTESACSGLSMTSVLTNAISLIETKTKIKSLEIKKGAHNIESQNVEAHQSSMIWLFRVLTLRISMLRRFS
jgi:hypothetical protein